MLQYDYDCIISYIARENDSKIAGIALIFRLRKSIISSFYFLCGSSRSIVERGSSQYLMVTLAGNYVNR